MKDVFGADDPSNSVVEPTGEGRYNPAKQNYRKSTDGDSGRSQMALKSISEPISYPDVFWASGDLVFRKVLPRGWRQESAEKQITRSMAEIRGNLNYHLLTHRRLVLTDTSLLMNPLLV